MARPKGKVEEKRIMIGMRVLASTHTDLQSAAEKTGLPIATVAAKLMDKTVQEIRERRNKKTLTETTTDENVNVNINAAPQNKVHIKPRHKFQDVASKCKELELEEDLDAEEVREERVCRADGPPSDKWGDYMTNEEYDELDRLNPKAPAAEVVDAEHIAKLRMQIAHLQYEGKNCKERKAVLAGYMQHVASVRAGTHKPPEGTPWTQDFSGMDVEDPPSGWGVYIPEFGYGMIDWQWYTKEEGFPEPKTVEEVKKKLDERKRLRQDPASRPCADFSKKKMAVFENKP